MVAVIVAFHSLSYCCSRTNSSKSDWSDAKHTASLIIYSASLLKVPASTTVSDWRKLMFLIHFNTKYGIKVIFISSLS